MLLFVIFCISFTMISINEHLVGLVDQFCFAHEYRLTSKWFTRYITRWRQDVNWTYIRRSEDILDIFWMPYIRSICVLCPGGNKYIIDQTLYNVPPQFHVIMRHILFELLGKHVNNKTVSKFTFSKAVIFFFFLSGFSLQTLTIHRTAGERRGPSFIPLYHFHPLTNIETFSCNFICNQTL